jgi:hypothetical protein
MGMCARGMSSWVVGSRDREPRSSGAVIAVGKERESYFRVSQEECGNEVSYETIVRGSIISWGEYIGGEGSCVLKINLYVATTAGTVKLFLTS